MEDILYNNFQKKLLMIPGPVEVGSEALDCLSHPIQPHYGDEWMELFNSTIKKLKKVFSTTNEIVIFAGTGSAAIESAISSTLEPNDKVLVCQNGYFSERLVEMITSWGGVPIIIKSEMNQAIDPTKVLETLKKDKEITNVNQVIDVISKIRSFKNELNVSPGSFVDISISELNLKNASIINDNLEVFKRLGRVKNVNSSKSGKNGVKIIIAGESITLYFDQNVDLNEQRLKLLNKTKDLDGKITSIKTKLKNKSFLKNAPKHIISRDKKALIDYEIELKKLNSIINSIKN